MRRSATSPDDFADAGALGGRCRSVHHRQRRQPLPPGHAQRLRVLRQVGLAGLAMVLVWPAARGHHAWLGWWPLWLVGMPLSAWWSLSGFPVPRWPQRRVQARRRVPPRSRRRGAA